MQLVGRAAEERELSAHVSAEAAGLLITGIRGVGKSALLNRLLDAAGTRRVVERVNCTRASQQIPFGAIAPILGPLAADAASQAQIMLRSFEVLRQRGGDGKLVLGLDDVHLIDDGSLAAIEPLVRRREVVLVATQPSELPVAPWIQSLVDEDHIRPFRVRPLTRERCTELVAAVLSGSVSEGLDDELWRLTEGVPLLVRQLLAAASDQSVLAKRRGAWVATASLVETVPMPSLLRTRLDRDPEELALLETIAVAGSLGARWVDDAGCGALAEELERVELIQVVRDGSRVSIELRHPLLAEYLDRSIPIMRRRRICRLLSEWLVDQGVRRRSDALKVAIWDDTAGTTSRPNLALFGAQHAVAAKNPALGERLARHAARGADRYAAEITLGHALIAQARSSEAEEAFERAAEAARSDAERSQAWTRRSQARAFGTADRAGALEMLSEAVSGLSDESGAEGLSIERARLATDAGDPDEAIRITEAVLARPGSDPQNHLDALLVLSMAQLAVGEFAEVSNTADRGRVILEDGAAKAPFAADRLRIGEVQAMIWTGRLAEASAIAEAKRRHRPDGSRETLPFPFWQLLCGQTAELRGDVARAGELAAGVVDELREVDPFGRRPLALVGQAFVGTQAGRASLVRQALDELDPAFVENEFRVRFVAERCEAWLHALAGDLSQAAHALIEVALDAIDHRQVTLAVFALHDVVRLGYPERSLDELERLAKVVSGPVMHAVLGRGRALDAGSGERLVAVAASFETMGMMLFAAETSAEAAGAFRSAGDGRAARRCATRAEVLLADCPGAHTPATVRVPSPLTPRQLEVARLASQFPNAEIARRLSISVRTVENHLAAAYTHLGVHSRSELANIFGTTVGTDR